MYPQARIVQDDGAGEGFEKPAIAFPRAPEIFFALPFLPQHKPGGPEGQQERSRHPTGDVEVVKRNVIGVTEEPIFKDLPQSEHRRDDGDARKRESRPEPTLLHHGCLLGCLIIAPHLAYQPRALSKTHQTNVLVWRPISRRMSEIRTL